MLQLQPRPNVSAVECSRKHVTFVFEASGKTVQTMKINRQAHKCWAAKCKWWHTCHSRWITMLQLALQLFSARTNHFQLLQVKPFDDWTCLPSVPVISMHRRALGGLLLAARLHLRYDAHQINHYSTYVCTATRGILELAVVHQPRICYSKLENAPSHHIRPVTVLGYSSCYIRIYQLTPDEIQTAHKYVTTKLWCPCLHITATKCCNIL